MKSPFRGWDDIPTDIDGVNPPQAAPYVVPAHIQVARYVLFVSVVAFIVVPFAIPGLLLMAWRSRGNR